MACSDWDGDMFEAMSEFAVRDFAYCEYQSAFGGPEFALLFFGVVSLGHWYKTGGLVGPMVIMVLIGGRVLTEVAGIAFGFVTLTVLLGGVAMVVLLRKLGKL